MEIEIIGERRNWKRRKMKKMGNVQMKELFLLERNIKKQYPKIIPDIFQPWEMVLMNAVSSYSGK